MTASPVFVNGIIPFNWIKIFLGVDAEKSF